jgi:hypothetical protein
MIQKIHSLSKLRRCELLNIFRSSIYYQLKSVSDTDQTLMKLIDETLTAKPIRRQLPWPCGQVNCRLIKVAVIRNEPNHLDNNI